MTVTDENRMICDPYPRLMVARDQVNQGAAALLMSVAAARRLGVAEEKWVYLRGHADQTEQDLLDRVDVGISISAKQAVAEALRVAGIGIDDVATFDLYSCFPFPVFAVCDEFGLATDDPRGLTLTGGLPYFGGPGQQLLAARYRRDGRRNAGQARGIRPCRRQRRCHEQVLGRRLLDRSPPTGWPTDSKALQQDIAALPKVPVTRNADGPATIETYSVRYDWPVTTGVIIGRLDADDSRFMAHHRRRRAGGADDRR